MLITFLDNKTEKNHRMSHTHKVCAKNTHPDYVNIFFLNEINLF